MAQPQAEFLALVEELCPSVNGASARRLTESLELNRSTDFQNACTLSDADCEWITSGIERSRVRVGHWADQLDLLQANGIKLLTILDAEYPAILQMVHDAPPFLFVRGELVPRDNRSIAIVGTRKASREGIDIARTLASTLSQQQITIVSGLAAGIDAAAHAGALDAGGRTIAVFGTGVRRVYPRENTGLAARVAAAGACVSQFLPDQRSTRWSFPVRNVVTSGLSVGTVVVEASDTSGAKLQAHNALDHGKRLFLLRHLVDHQPWAEALIGRPGVMTTDDVDEIAEAVATDVFRMAAPACDDAAQLIEM